MIEFDHKNRYDTFQFNKNIYNLIHMVKTYVPLTNIELVTNGDVLNKKRWKKLFNAGLDKILISAYDGEKEAVIIKGLINIFSLKVIMH